MTVYFSALWTDMYLILLGFQYLCTVRESGYWATYVHIVSITDTHSVQMHADKSKPERESPAGCVSCVRYDLGAEHARDKERYAAREREDVIRKSKERKVAEVKVRGSAGLHALHVCMYYCAFMHYTSVSTIHM